MNTSIKTELKTERKNIRKIYSFFRPYLRYIILSGFCVVTYTAVTLTLPWVVRHLIDSVFVDKNGELLGKISIGLIFLFILLGFVAFLRNYYMEYIGQRVTADLRIGLFERLQSLSINFFDNRRTGEIISRFTNDVTIIQNAAVNIPMTLFRQLILFFGGIAIILYMNWKLTGLIILLVPVVITAARYYGVRIKKYSIKVQDKLGSVTTILEEVISSIRLVKSFVREDYEKDRFSRQVEKTFETALCRLKLSATFGPVLIFLTYSISTAILWFGGLQVIKGNITPGELIAFILYAVMISGPMGTFARLYTQVQEALGAMHRVFDLFEKQPEIIDLPNAPKIGPVKGKVKFNDVCFEYTSGVPVLKNINFECSPGEIIALVGPSGAGKTTFINLIHRFYDPLRGTIEIDGNNIREINLRSLLLQIALVPQETFLFGSTIRENIRYGRIEATQSELIEAAKAANAHQFISELPEGYDTNIGEKGIKLSGGQRQRLAIARAILKNPRILIFDEGMSSLDNQSEALIQEALENFMAFRTTFIIAHRLSTVQHADRIIVMDQGEIIEEGKHADLLKQKGLYHYLYTLRLFEE
ncbi:MAG: ABC transporter transmembrane domain-containing protein [Nitrospinota bacterium]|nr:ABC transporter transmembrane domain-containing protein [Nitrospinota bacterium]